MFESNNAEHTKYVKEQDTEQRNKNKVEPEQKRKSFEDIYSQQIENKLKFVYICNCKLKDLG